MTHTRLTLIQLEKSQRHSNFTHALWEEELNIWELIRDENKIFYWENRTILMKSYRGKYIAVSNKTILYVSETKKKISEKFRDDPTVFIDCVGDEEYRE